MQSPRKTRRAALALFIVQYRLDKILQPFGGRGAKGFSFQLGKGFQGNFILFDGFNDRFMGWIGPAGGGRHDDLSVRWRKFHMGAIRAILLPPRAGFI